MPSRYPLPGVENHPEKADLWPKKGEFGPFFYVFRPRL